jgi:tRNA (guanine26-N2/guanine27-N2)-dimethyltransferase
MEAAGPLWLGNLADASFCDEMIRLSNTSFIGGNPRFMEILARVKGEVGLPPGFIDLDKTCSGLGVSSASLDSVLDGLREAGFDAVRSHADDRGIKTNAPFEELEGIILGLHESNSGDSVERKVDE